MALLLPVMACSSDGQTSADPPTSSPATTSSASPLAVPPGGIDCGTINELSGWPTTVAVNPEAFGCIADALVSGTAARMVVISPGQQNGGRKTEDGYDIPTHRLATWIVLGKSTLQQTTDLTE